MVRPDGCACGRQPARVWTSGSAPCAVSTARSKSRLSYFHFGPRLHVTGLYKREIGNTPGGIGAWKPLGDGGLGQLLPVPSGVTNAGEKTEESWKGGRMERREGHRAG